jgi:hypothetical protein
LIKRRSRWKVESVAKMLIRSNASISLLVALIALSIASEVICQTPIHLSSDGSSVWDGSCATACPVSNPCQFPPPHTILEANGGCPIILLAGDIPASTIKLMGEYEWEISTSGTVSIVDGQLAFWTEYSGGVRLSSANLVADANSSLLIGSPNITLHDVRYTVGNDPLHFRNMSSLTLKDSHFPKGPESRALALFNVRTSADPTSAPVFLMDNVFVETDLFLIQDDSDSSVANVVPWTLEIRNSNVTASLLTLGDADEIGLRDLVVSSTTWQVPAGLSFASTLPAASMSLNGNVIVSNDFGSGYLLIEDNIVSIPEISIVECTFNGFSLNLNALNLVTIEQTSVVSPMATRPAIAIPKAATVVLRQVASELTDHSTSSVVISVGSSDTVQLEWNQVTTTRVNEGLAMVAFGKDIKFTGDLAVSLPSLLASSGQNLASAHSIRLTAHVEASEAESTLTLSAPLVLLDPITIYNVNLTLDAENVTYYAADLEDSIITVGDEQDSYVHFTSTQLVIDLSSATLDSQPYVPTAGDQHPLINRLSGSLSLVDAHGALGLELVELGNFSTAFRINTAPNSPSDTNGPSSATPSSNSPNPDEPLSASSRLSIVLPAVLGLVSAFLVTLL